MQRLQTFSRPQRIFVFIMIFGGIALLALGISIVLVLNALSTAPRTQSKGLVSAVTVAEFVTLPDDDSFPAALATGPDGTVYTGSYVSGAIWAITPDGTLSEIPATRELIGAVAGLAVAPDGTLFVVDRLAAQIGSGGKLWTVTPDNVIEEYATIDDETGFVRPDDVALDTAGNVYVTDWGRDEVWRFAPDRTGDVFWTPPPVEGVDNPAPTGLDYDPTRQALIITDPATNRVYAVSLEGGETELLYVPEGEDDLPGFDGVTVDSTGGIYVAELGRNRISLLKDGFLLPLADDFRGASDVDYADGKLYVTNWDQRWMLTDLIPARLPFALDVITLKITGR